MNGLQLSKIAIIIFQRIQSSHIRPSFRGPKIPCEQLAFPPFVSIEIMLMGHIIYILYIECVQCGLPQTNIWGRERADHKYMSNGHKELSVRRGLRCGLLLFLDQFQFRTLDRTQTFPLTCKLMHTLGAPNFGVK